MRIQSNNPALSGALPFIGSGAALIAMLTIGMISFAGMMMSSMVGY